MDASRLLSQERTSDMVRHRDSIMKLVPFLFLAISLSAFAGNDYLTSPLILNYPNTQSAALAIACFKVNQSMPFILKAGDYYNQGYAKFRNGNLQGAVSDYSKAIMLNPDDGWLYNNRGLAELNMGHLEDALLDFNKSLVIDPENATAFYNRGVLKTGRCDFAGAIADYSLAIAVRPDYAKAYNNRGSCKESLNDIAGAKSDFQRAIELDPQYPAPQSNLLALQSRSN